MSIRISNSYKNTLKKLGRGGCAGPLSSRSKLGLNIWETLSSDSDSEEDGYAHNTNQRKDDSAFYDDYLSRRLPGDVINLIIEYLPVFNRIENLREKYDLVDFNWWRLRNDLYYIPMTPGNLDRLFICAKISRAVIDLAGQKFPNRSRIEPAMQSIETYQLSKICRPSAREEHAPSRPLAQREEFFYMQSFVDLIVCAFYNYPAIYDLVRPSEKDYRAMSSIRVVTNRDLVIKWEKIYIVEYKRLQKSLLEKLMLKLFATAKYYGVIRSSM